MADQSETVKLALRRFKLAVEADKAQRDREVADLKFQVPEHQWDSDAKSARGATTIDGVVIPARPMLSIPKLDQPIQLVLNQERSAHLGVVVDPLGEDADDDTAEVIQDLYRRIERDSRAGLARSWAFDRAVKCGRGAYRVNTKYCDDGGHPFDQDITIDRILYQSAVYFDPFAQEPDWSDGEWCFVTTWMPWDKYVREYGESDLAKGGSSELESLAEEAPEWVQTDATAKDSEEAGKAVLVAEYWRKSYTDKTWAILDDGSFSYDDEIPDGRKVHPKETRKRKVRVPKVMWSVINGREEIQDAQEWNGKYIPIIPVLGRELQPFDKERIFVGIIGPAKDAQRLFNHAASSAVELAAMEPKAPFDIDPLEIEGYEPFWQQANLRNLPYLPRHKMINGQPTGPLQRIQTDAGKLGPSMMLLQQADQFIQASTATFDPSLGRLPQKDRSGRAIMALQEQSDAGNSHFLHSLAAISMTYEAKVVIDLMASIYDRPGRVARLLDFEDNARTVILNQPFTMNDKGRPTPAPENHPNAKHYDLRTGSYGVNVTIGKSWQSRLQQGEAEIGHILESSPQLMPLIGPTYFKFRDFPGSKEIAELLKKMRAQQFPFLEEKDGEQPDAQQLQATVQQLQQQLQQMQQQLQQAGQIIQTEGVKQHAQVEIAQAKAQADLQAKDLEQRTKLEIERMNNATQIAVARIKAMASGAEAQLELQEEQIALGQTMAHEAGMAAVERAHEAAMAQQGHQLALEQGQQQAEMGAVAADQAHAQTLAAQQQQADLQPKNGAVK